MVNHRLFCFGFNYFERFNRHHILHIRQEGWRLEQEDLSDPSSKLRIKGVVYNEMKGVFADSQQLFGRHLLSQVLPSHTYGNCSGGLPERWDYNFPNSRQAF